MIAVDTRVKLGTYGDKLYVWNATQGKLEWSVPDPRSAVRAPRGYKILAADYSQIEVKLMAYLSGDPVLIEAINSGQDVHSFNATKVFGKRYDFDYELMEKARKDPDHPRHNELSLIRGRIKTVTFGVPYGAGPTRVALMTGMSLEESKEFIETFFATFKVLKAWLQEQGLLAIECGYSTSIDGRKRFYELPSASDPDVDGLVAQIKRWAGNMPIQASNADILKRAMRQIYLDLRGGSFVAARLYDARFLLVVHDEIVMVVREDHIPAVKQIMAKAMNDAYYHFVPRPGVDGTVLLGGKKHDFGVEVVEADIWAKA